jgi:nucleoside-diphosphate-sugar epimerase
MNFLITGGAGFLGINLIRFLLNKGHRVVSLDLVDFDYEDVKSSVLIIRGDIRTKQDVERAMEAVDIVVHTAAALPLYPRKAIYTTDVLGTRLLLESAHKHKVKRFIHVSSTAVYGLPDHHPILETDKLEGVGPYGVAKIQAEEECVKYRQKGMCVPIVRPKTFIGPERLGVFAMLYEWAEDGKGFPVIGTGNNRYQLLDVEDLCDAIYFCATLDERTVNDTFNIGAKVFTTMKEDYQAVLDEAGFGKSVIGLPEKPVIWTLRILESLKLSPLYNWIYETASRDSFVAIEKAERVLSFTPRYSNKQALVRNYMWYLDNRKRFKNQSGVSHRVPWRQGILKLAKMFF